MQIALHIILPAMLIITICLNAFFVISICKDIGHETNSNKLFIFVVILQTLSCLTLMICFKFIIFWLLRMLLIFLQVGICGNISRLLQFTKLNACNCGNKVIVHRCTVNANIFISSCYCNFCRWRRSTNTLRLFATFTISSIIAFVVIALLSVHTFVFSFTCVNF